MANCVLALGFEKMQRGSLKSEVSVCFHLGPTSYFPFMCLLILRLHLVLYFECVAHNYLAACCHFLPDDDTSMMTAPTPWIGMSVCCLIYRGYILLPSHHRCLLQLALSTWRSMVSDRKLSLFSSSLSFLPSFLSYFLHLTYLHAWLTLRYY